MLPAFQKDEAFLADLEHARNGKKRRLWWLGQSGFLLYAHGTTILFDPYLTDSLTRKYAGTGKPHVRITERVIAPERLAGVDVTTSSHSHTDHFDPDTLKPLFESNPEATLIVPEANRHLVQEKLGGAARKVIGIDAGQTVEIAGVKFTAIASAHNSVEYDEQGYCRFLGYVAQIGELTIYHSGDTLLHQELEPALRKFLLDVVLLPINGNKPERKVAGNMDGLEAARLAKAVGAKLVVPHHFDMFEFNTVAPDEFEAECRRLGQPFRTLRNGEGLDFDLL